MVNFGGVTENDRKKIVITKDSKAFFHNNVDYCVGTGRMGLALTREFDSWISEKSTCRSHKTCFFCVKFLVFIYCILLQCVVRYNKGGILHASYYIEI